MHSIVTRDVCSGENAAMKITGRDTGATGAEFADYVMETMSRAR